MTQQGGAKAVILGGTGHIGSAIARRFDAAGYEVVAVGHRDVERPNLAGSSVTVAVGDDAEPSNLAHWFRGASVVVDCGTPYPVWIHDKSKRVQADFAVERVRSVLAEVQKAGARLLQVTSFTTLPRHERFFAAATRGALYGAHPYFELKERVEAEVQLHLDQGHPGAIIAPSTCFGPYDMKAREQTFIPMLISGKVPVIAAQNMNVVDVRDVADVVFAARNRQFASPIPVFGHNITLKDLVHRICAIGDVPEPKLSMPASLGAAGMYWMENAYALAGKQSPWPSISVVLLAASYFAEPSRTQVQLHPTLRPLEETLRDAVQWYQSIGYISG